MGFVNDSTDSVYSALLLAYSRVGRPVTVHEVRLIGLSLLRGRAPRSEIRGRSGGHTPFSFGDRVGRHLRRLVGQGKAEEVSKGHFVPTEEPQEGYLESALREQYIARPGNPLDKAFRVLREKELTEEEKDKLLTYLEEE